MQIDKSIKSFALILILLYILSYFVQYLLPQQLIRNLDVSQVMAYTASSRLIASAQAIIVGLSHFLIAAWIYKNSKQDKLFWFFIGLFFSLMGVILWWLVTDRKKTT